MLLSLRGDHKEHLQLLTEQTTQVVVDFCKLAIDYLNNGPNLKLYKAAASKLDLDFVKIENCVHGLVNLLLLAAKHKLNEADFRDSVLTLGFTEERQTILREFYKTKCKEIAEILKRLTLKEQHYYNLEWRFEVEVSSRALLHQAIPLITMDLSLKKGDQINSQLLQTDPNNLLHVADELEKALIESRSRYARRIQRTFVE